MKKYIQYTGQFKCSEIALISLTGKIAGIKSVKDEHLREFVQ